MHAEAAAKPHVISFGKSTAVKWLTGANEENAVELKVRALYVDARLKEYTLGLPHDITDRLFVVRRAYRLNDTLPEDKAPQWRWQRGGWLLVDRSTGHIAQVALPEFDPYYSAVTWYRDYAAYCGMAGEGKTPYVLVAQLGRRKPIVKKSLATGKTEGLPDSLCAAPRWQRPGRVTFEADGASLSFDVRGQTAGPVVAEAGEEEDSD